MLDWFKTFETALAEWDPATVADDHALALDERAAILERYPRPDWPRLTVGDFAQGVGAESFTSWLEHRSKHICALPARHAGIHLIYKEGGEHWRFPKGYKDVQEAWAAIRAGYVQAYELCEAGDYAAIDKLEVFKPGRLTLHKAVHVYAPERQLPIAATSHLQFFAERVLRDEWSKNVHGRMGHCELNSVLLDALRQQPALADQDTVQLMYFLYGWGGVQDARRVFKIAPGDDGKYWDACRDDGYICVGWDNVGDLDTFESKRAFQAAFEAAHTDLYNGHRPTLSKKGSEVWTMRTIPKGSIVLANKGTSALLGVGEITGDYDWRAERDEYRHTRPVRWDPRLAGPIPKQSYWAVTTVHEVPPRQFDEILGTLIGTPPKPAGYAFYRHGGLDAHVGLAVRGEQLAVYLPSMGGTISGERRNPDRPALWAHLREALTQSVSARVVGLRVGEKSNEPTELGTALADGGVQALDDGFRQGRNYRFDFWLALRGVASVAQLAEELELQPIDHRSVPVLWPKFDDREPRWWIFQANPNFYDLDKALAHGIRNTEWKVTRHQKDVRVGDRVFLWLSGANAGVRAIATVTEGVRERDWEDDGFSVGTVEGTRAPRVSLQITTVVEGYVSRGTIRSTPGLSELSIIASPQGTNFAVEPAEAELLLALIHKGAVLDPTDKVTFDDVMGALATADLYFLEETVANFLLALQAKRFVILTGISGTGKTQLAMAVAECFPLQESVVEQADDTPEDATVITVQPYMLKYNRFVLPADFVGQVPGLANLDGSRSIRVRFPGGELPLRLYDGGRYVLLSLKRAARDWFQANVSLNQHFIVEAELEDDSLAGLRLSLPVEQRVTTRAVEHSGVVAVRPDWTDNRHLLGSRSPIFGTYGTTPFLRILLRAAAEAKRAKKLGEDPRPFFVVLDEMNLARVEHYFSDFLSAMESEKPLHLHDDPAIELGEVEESEPIPQRMSVPENLFFIGTVNVDETTYMFSPKVLDRAFTIELNDVNLEGLDGESREASPLRMDEWDGKLVGRGKPSATDWQRMGRDLGDLRSRLVALHDLLADENRHFGYRVANEIARFVNLAHAQSSDRDAAHAALDLAIMQKVLPKLYGAQQELSTLLDRLLAFALDVDESALSTWAWNPSSGWIVRGGEGGAEQRAGSPLFPRTARKLWRMRRRLQQQGFTAFVE